MIRRVRRAWKAFWDDEIGTPFVAVTNVHRIVLGPTDVILIEVTCDITTDTAGRIQDQIRRYFPNHQAMVISDDLKFRVVTRDQVEAVAARLVTAGESAS